MDACEIQAAPPLLKLNLGCGSNMMDGFINVDMFGDPDLKLDLERVELWPWAENSIDTVHMSHVLEHIGFYSEDFLAFMRELYRVCCNGAKIHIAVPHPRHDNFIGDPTHVRVITPQVMSLFSKKNCEEWQSKGYSNTPLALYHEVNFETVDVQYVPDWKYQKLPMAHLMEMSAHQFNIIAEIRMVLEVIK